MTEFVPLRGFKYNLNKLNTMKDLLCPPYDMITPELKRSLEKQNKYNSIWLEGTSDSTDKEKYLKTKRIFDDWVNDEILIRDSQPNFQILKYTYQLNNVHFTLTGITGALRVEQYSSNNIIAHENTYAPIVQDRINLLENTGIQFSPILATYRNASKPLSGLLDQITSSKPDLNVHIDEFSNIKIWKLINNTNNTLITQALNHCKVFIADGHHRYEAALGIQNSTAFPNSAVNYVMATLVDIEDPGLQILPYHRILQNFKTTNFDVLEHNTSQIYDKKNVEDISEYDLSQLINIIQSNTREKHSLCLLNEATGKLITFSSPNGKELNNWGLLGESDAWIMEKHIIKPILENLPASKLTVNHNLFDTVKSVIENKNSTGILFGSFPKESFEQVALTGINLPPKSTFFYPKIPTGLVFHPTVLRGLSLISSSV